MAKKHNAHDSGYKKLFSNHEFLRQLLTSFVHEEWINDIDYSTLVRLDKSFVSDEFNERESDLIYKAEFKGQVLYIFILLEFQSTVDRFMSLRMLHYIVELYEDLVKNHRLKTLPAVFPVMLYNGEKRWTAPEELSILIENTIPVQYVPVFRYYKIAENEFSKEFLKSLKNSVAALFYTERCSDEELKKEIEIILQLLKTEKPTELTLFINWFKHMFHDKKELVEEVQGLEEVSSMLRTTVKNIEARNRLEGKLEGKLETAKAMVKRKMSVKEISEITGLPVAEIEKLKQDQDFQD
jgi:predicted transposase/invertase (TIGR01784 family)